MEDEVQGQDQASQEAVADGALEEGHDFGLESGVLGLSEPVLEGGARDAGLLGELALRAGRMVGMGEVVSGLGSLGSIPTEGVWSAVGVGVKLGESHGP